jgi:hypothetical protein|tara:strand:+ start:526 stop:783 length:258 start_codon:yes stop_codon:yes gene_type:complete
MIIATSPNISAEYLISKIGEKALRSLSLSPLDRAMRVNIIKPPLIRKNIICDGDKKDPEILTNVSPTAKAAIEINMSRIPLEFFF